MRIVAKKSLGQHFLSAPSYLKKIVDAGKVTVGDVVLEVGPGKGTLTRELLSRGAKVVAVEKDDRLIPELQELFIEEIRTKKFTLVHGDILEQDLLDLGLKAGRYKVVANIPYYISGLLMRFFLTHKNQPSAMSLLVQKEVAERIARSRKESLLSLSVKAYGTPTFVAKVPAGAFSPPPKVDSAILAIENISQDHFEDTEHEKKFFELLHAGFAHKRKQLGKELRPLLGEQVDAIASARAEDIPLETWLSLSKSCSSSATTRSGS